MTNILCLLYVGWITNYVANSPKVAEGGGEADRKLEEDSKGETLRIIQRLDRLESVVNEHIKGQQGARVSVCVWGAAAGVLNAIPTPVLTCYVETDMQVFPSEANKPAAAPSPPSLLSSSEV